MVSGGLLLLIFFFFFFFNTTTPNDSLISPHLGTPTSSDGGHPPTSMDGWRDGVKRRGPLFSIPVTPDLQRVSIHSGHRLAELPTASDSPPPACPGARK
jgi:hypothetical protein